MSARVRAPRAGWALLALLTLAFASLCALFVSLAYAAPLRLGDVQIYRGAVLYVAGGGHLYDFEFAFTSGGVERALGFTYPPIAALLLWPLGWLSQAAADALWVTTMIASCLALALSLVSGLRREGRLSAPPLDRPEAWTPAVAAALALATSYPFVHNFVVGQVTLFLVLLVYVDAVIVPPRWRGVLVGLAAAFKLTSLVFVAHFVLTRQWRAAAVSGGTFVGATAVGWLALPRASADYWTKLLWRTERVGEQANVDNKAILGALSRWLPEGGHITWWWVAAALGVGLVGFWRAARLHRAGRVSSGALIVGCVSLAVSPISWGHHLFWAVLAGITLVVLPDRRWRVLGLAVLAVFAAVSPASGVPGALTWDAQRWLVEAPTAMIVALCLFGLPAQPRQAGPGDADGRRE